MGHIDIDAFYHLMARVGQVGMIAFVVFYADALMWFSAMICRTLSVIKGEGSVLPGVVIIAIKFRMICAGVIKKPNGNPHHPSTDDNMRSRSCFLRAHSVQTICSFVFKESPPVIAG